MKNLLAIVLTLCCFSTSVWAAKTQFAIYDPAEGKDGVWSAETIALIQAIKKMGWTVQTIGDKELNSPPYEFKALIQPGGYATHRVKRIGEDGLKNIKRFVIGGGGYVGFCAGAYLATANWDWAEEFSRQGGIYGDSEDYEQFQTRAIASLYQGWAVGPFGWHAWNQGTTPASLERTMINRNIAPTKKAELPGEMNLFYYGGPFFEFDETPEHLQVWARAIAPKAAPKYATEAHAKPTIVSFTLGLGNVSLSSYHPVFTLVNSKRTPVEPKSDEWNLLHAILARGLGK